MKTIIRTSVVCNPWDIKNSEHYAKFEEMLRDMSKMEVERKELNNGYVKINMAGPKDEIKLLQSPIKYISLRRVRLMMNVDLKKDAHCIESVVDTALIFISKYFGLHDEIGAEEKIFIPPKLKGNEMNKRIIVVYPYFLKTRENIYDTNERILELQYTSNLNNWRNYVVMPRNPLTRYSIDALNKRGLTVDVDQLLEHEDLVMVNYKNMKSLTELKTDIILQNQSFSQEGYFGVNTTSMNFSEIDIMDEIVHMWGGTLEAEYHESRIYRISHKHFIDYSTHDFSLHIREWLRRSVSLVMEGKLPLIRVTGPWMSWTNIAGEEDESKDHLNQLRMRLS